MTDVSGYRRTTAAEKAALVAANREADEKRLGEIYGKLLPDVLFLRGRDNSVMKEGGQLLLNGQPVTADELKARAARERRLANATTSSGVRRVTETASGLAIGGTVPFAPRPTTSAPRPLPKPQPAIPSVPPALRGAAKAAKAKAEQPSTDLGARPRVVWLDLGLLDVDRTYQREIGEGGQTHINRIVRGFNWNCYQPIIVTESKDGRYAVIDGQHRLEAAKKHPLIDSLPCYIIDAPDLAMQAKVFVEVNTSRRSLTSAQKYFASLAGGEASAVSLDAICKEAGVTILRGAQGSTPPMSILGPLVAQRLVTRFGAAAVRTAVRLLAETHRETRGAFRSSTLSALTRIAADRKSSRARLQAVLAAADLDRLYGEALVLAKGSNGKSLGSAMEKVLRTAMDEQQAA